MPPYQFLRDLYVARATALSRNTNPRNYEFIWHPFWTLVSTHFAKRFHQSAITAPQYPLWCLWRKDEDFPMLVDSEADGVDDEGISGDDGSTRDVGDAYASDHESPDEYAGDYESPDDSMDDDSDVTGDDGSTGETGDAEDAHTGDHESPNVSVTIRSVEGTIDYDSRRRITDFAILLETVINHDFPWVEDQWEDSVDVIMPVPGPDKFSADISEWILSLIEIKPLPSRSLTEEKHKEMRAAKMTQAQLALRIQVGSLIHKCSVVL